MGHYTKSMALDSQRDINVSVRLNAAVKSWLDRKCEIECLSLSSYIYEILNFSNSSPDPKNPYDMREELPYLAQIHEAYKRYLNQYKITNNQFEEKISIYLDGAQKLHIENLTCLYSLDMSEIIRKYIHFFFIADGYFKTHFDLVKGLHHGLLLNQIKPRYFMKISDVLDR